MSEEAGFLARLYEYPEDDTTRLVYADWLQERGDVRGDYLRTEVELAALDGQSEQATALEQALAVLRGDVREEWLELAAKRYDVCVVPTQAGEPRLTVITENCLRQQAEQQRQRIEQSAWPPWTVLLRPAQAPKPRLTRYPAPGDPAGHALRLVRVTKKREAELMARVRAVRGGTDEDAQRFLSERDLPRTLRTFATVEEARRAARGFRDLAAVEVRVVDPRRGVLNRPTVATFSVVLHSYPKEVKKQLVEIVSLMLGRLSSQARAFASRPLPLVVRAGMDWQTAEALRLALPARAEVSMREDE